MQLTELAEKILLQATELVQMFLLGGKKTIRIIQDRDTDGTCLERISPKSESHILIKKAQPMEDIG